MIRFLLTVALAVGLTTAVQAQSLPEWAETGGKYQPPSDDCTSGRSLMRAAPDPCGDPPTLPTAPNQVPVDGGLGLLALAGAGYAVRKLRQKPTD